MSHNISCFIHHTLFVYSGLVGNWVQAGDMPTSNDMNAIVDSSSFPAPQSGANIHVYTLPGYHIKIVMNESLN